MKRLFLALILVAGGVVFAANANAQVYIGARLGFRAPFRRAYCSPPAVIYGSVAPVPYYGEGVAVGAPVYGGYPYYRHYYGRAYYHEPRLRRWRRW
jgi:hypothetical protein